VSRPLHITLPSDPTGVVTAIRVTDK
jgi:hypothetical protein